MNTILDLIRATYRTEEAKNTRGIVAGAMLFEKLFTTASSRLCCFTMLMNPAGLENARKFTIDGIECAR